MKRDVTLDPGWTITGVVLGPDGQPLAGAFGMGIGQLKTAEFTMRSSARGGHESSSSCIMRRG